MKNKKAGSWMLRSIIIFTLAIFSFSTVLAFTPPTTWSPTNVGAGSGVDLTLPGGSIGGIISMITTWLVGMFAFFGIIGFTVSGIMYLVSAGNDEMITKAKKYMMYSLVGVIVGLSGYVILQAVDLMLDASSTF